MPNRGQRVLAHFAEVRRRKSLQSRIKVGKPITLITPITLIETAELASQNNFKKKKPKYIHNYDI